MFGHGGVGAKVTLMSAVPVQKERKNIIPEPIDEPTRLTLPYPPSACGDPATFDLS